MEWAAKVDQRPSLIGRMEQLFGGSRENREPIGPREFRVSMTMVAGALAVATAVFQLAAR